MRYLESAGGPSDSPSAERDAAPDAPAAAPDAPAAAPDMQFDIDLPTLNALDDELASALANLTTLREPVDRLVSEYNCAPALIEPIEPTRRQGQLAAH